MGRRKWLALTVSAAVIFADQVTKWWITAVVMQPPQRIFVTPFFDLVLAWNRGISFGLFSTDSPWNAWLLSGLAAAIVVALLIWLWRAETVYTALSLGLIIGGALGNVADRLRIGAVIDFLDFHVAGYHWPAFNVADSAITIGAVLLIGESLIFRDQKRHKSEDS